LNPWELIIQQPVINVLIVLSHYMADSFGLAIIALTIIVNLIILPLSLKQMRASKAMQDLQPKIQELQKKYAKDKQKLAQEQMRLYKESGMSPTGCLLPLLIQMPVWIALYQSVILSLAVAPEGLLNLSRYLYDWPVVYAMLPLGNDFLWLNLVNPDMFLAIMVGVTMWLQQKMATPMSADPKQRQQSQMMLWMMPLMFTLLAVSFPSGLSLFWVTSSIVRIIMQYYVTGWGGLAPMLGRKPSGAGGDKQYRKLITQSEQKSPADSGADITITADEPEKGERGQDYLARLSRTRYQPGRDRAQRRRKKR